jgi:tetratricopeptide (TPR) repeat protein
MAGDYVTAKKIVVIELRRLEAQRPQNKRRIIRVLGQLSRLSSVLNDLPAAEAYEQRALALARKQPGLHALDLLDLRHQIGLLQSSQGKLAEVPILAETKLQQAQLNFESELEGREKLFGDHSAQNIHTWRDIADNLESQRLYEKAYEARMKEFALLRTIYGDDHFAMANIYMDLGRITYKLEQYPESVNLFGKAVTLLSKHDPVANCLILRDAQTQMARSAAKMGVAVTQTGPM